MIGREQAGRRPFVIVASDLYLSVVDSLALSVPITRTDRRWPNRPCRPTRADGLPMTEQLRTLSRNRFDGYISVASTT